MASFMGYQYISEKTESTISKKTITLFYLIFMQILFLLFQTDLLFLIFLDFSCFLGYQLKKRKEALILSIINIIYCYFRLPMIPWYTYIIYLGYFLLDCLVMKNRKNSINYLVVCKTFFTSFLYFLYFDHSILGIFSLIFIFFYFAFLLEMTYSYLRNYEIKKHDDTVIFQIAHEVKNPISVCKGYLDMLDSKQQEKVDKYIPIIRSEMNRALTIMDDFLNLKRLTLHKDIMDLYLLLDDIESTVESILGNKNVTLKLPKMEEDELLLEGDYDRLKQVFMNLIKNAYEANAKTIRIELFSKKDQIEVHIIDDGDGISKQDLSKIGQIFYTTKIKGTGIGISMSKEIIKLHQGTIRYASSLGKGTKVTLTLPSKLLY